jgi:hypothetical protein
MATKRSYSPNSARKGKDIGKPGKNFSKIARRRPARSMALRPPVSGYLVVRAWRCRIWPRLAIVG